ncbi:hypothetical protein HU200_012845 [Digitaria exilis]|uniref:Uncharacterized protein n=1 Tax=Digitaria exilis TaxID=1010633 RepID=A0A835FEQ2_9POAL|nr:hypothetical protein HU200_012845 [Digitaria exilis]
MILRYTMWWKWTKRRITRAQCPSAAAHGTLPA